MLCGAGARAAEVERPSLVGEFQARADAIDLHRHPYWRLLLHMETGLFGTRSLIDDPDFFLSPRGKRDARAELHATLAAFFAPAAEDAARHPVCRFAARFAWLKQELEIPADALPVPACQPFEDVFTELNPRSVALAFPSTYINSPPSMFGHTLIVVDTEGRNRLLAKAMSYAGEAGGGFTPLFILGSFIGSYDGHFSFQDYYDKVEEYRDIGHRDIWEYELDFDTDAMRRLVAHAWELQGIASDYYFFTENCAYNLLYLLDAGRPEADLRRQFRYWVVPIDTVKAVCDARLVRSRTYRPSKTSTIGHLRSLLSPAHQTVALAIATGTQDPTTVDWEAISPPLEGGVPPPPQHTATRILTLELAAETIQYRYTTRDISPEDYRPRFLKTLRARSALGEPGHERTRVPAPAPPEAGHDGNRVSIGAGVRDGDAFVDLHYRPAYHALAEPITGYDAGAQIEFMHFHLRYDPSLDNPRDDLLERLDVIDIYSLSPRDAFFQPNAWRATAGVHRRQFADGTRPLVGQLHLGGGYAYTAGPDGRAFLMTDYRAEFGEVYADGYVAGLGATAGWVLSPTERWRLRVQGEGAYFVGRNQDFPVARGALSQTLRLTRDSNLSADVTYDLTDAEQTWEFSTAWHLYY